MNQVFNTKYTVKSKYKNVSNVKKNNYRSLSVNVDKNLFLEKYFRQVIELNVIHGITNINVISLFYI